MVLCGRKSETAVANARIFEIMLRAIGIGAAGYAKPNNAHTAKSKNMAAKRNRVITSCQKVVNRLCYLQISKGGIAVR
jgi:hypothetical protein